MVSPTLLIAHPACALGIADVIFNYGWETHYRAFSLNISRTPTIDTLQSPIDLKKYMNTEITFIQKVIFS